MIYSFRKICLLIGACVLLPLHIFCQISIGGYNVYYGSLHDHCNISDGTGTAAQAYAYARDVGQLDFFGLSDHSNLISSTEWTLTKNTANAANQDSVFVAFWGFEWTTYLTYGHVTIVNTDDYCSNSGSTSNFTGLLSWLNTRNGVAFFNHPGWEFFTLNEFNHFTDTPSMKFVGIELWNTLDGFDEYYYNDGYYSGDGNKGYYDEALIRHWKIGAAGGDDNHSATWGTASQMRLAILSPALTRTDLFNALLARRFFSTEDKTIALSFKIGGNEMGSDIAAGSWTATAMATDAENETFTKIDLLKNGVVIHSWTLNQTNPVVNQPLTCAMGEYYYMRATQADGNEAISSPVFISYPANVLPQISLTSPPDNSQYLTGSVVSIDAIAVDTDGTIAKVEFYDGLTKIGEDYSSPYSIDWIAQPQGNHTLSAMAYDNQNATATSAGVYVSVVTPIAVSMSLKISDGTDDAEEDINGRVVLNNDDLDLVYDNKVTGNQTVGLFFRSAGIPQDAVVTKAEIRFKVRKPNHSACELHVSGELSANPTEFTREYFNISNRNSTLSNITWIPSSSGSAGNDESYLTTPGLKTLVQEIIHQPDWNSTSSLVFLITGSGTRIAESFESDKTEAATLFLEYYYIPSPENDLAENDKPAQTRAVQTSEMRVRLFPNPASGQFTVDLTSQGVINAIQVYNLAGSLVDGYYPQLPSRQAEINCSIYPDGMYLVKISSDQGSRTLKMIKK